MFLREEAKIQYLLTSRSFFLASQSTGISLWPLPHNKMKFLSTITQTPRFNFAILLVLFADLHVDFVNKFWTRLTMKWAWREHEVARRQHILFCLVVFGVFAFLMLASAQVNCTLHIELRFIYLFRSYICVFTLCCVRVGLYFFSAMWTRSEIFQLRVKTYSLRPQCAPSFRS